MALIQNGQLNLLKVAGSDSYFSLVTDNPLAVYVEKYKGYQFIKEVEKYGKDLFWKHPDNPIPEIDSENLIRVSPLFPKISKSTFLAVAEFYYRYALDFRKHTEVGSMILFNQQTEKLVLVVPQQQVSYGSVNWEKLLDEDRPVCHFSGERTTLTELMVDHLFVGHCHSHNTMGLSRPSVVDDRTECGSVADPKPLSFNLLFSSYSLNTRTNIVKFVLTPSFGYNGERVLFTEESLELLFEEDIFRYQVPSSKENELTFEVSLKELVGNYNPDIHTVVTDRPAGSTGFLKPAAPPQQRIGRHLWTGLEEEEYELNPDIAKWAHSYLAVSGDDPDDFIFALAVELGVIQ